MSTISSIVGAVIQSNASEDASEAQADAAEGAQDVQLQSAEMQLDFLRDTRRDIADAVEAGLIDLDAGMNAAIAELRPLLDDANASVEDRWASDMYRDLMEDPTAIKRRPTYEFQYDEGIDALQSAFSRTSGGGMSGRAIKAAQEYGQNFAAQMLNEELRRLEPMLQMEDTALRRMDTTRTNIAELYKGLGAAKANLRVGGATGSSQAVGQAMPTLAQTYGNVGNAALSQGQAYATGAINQGNIWGNWANQQGQDAANIAMMFATRGGSYSGG